MVSFRTKGGFWHRPRLKKLHALQEELFRQLQLLMPEHIAHHDTFTSRVAGSPPLWMDVLERHPYTTFFRLTYAFDSAERDAHSPEAHIRLYQDVRMAEVTAFDTEQGCKRVAHPWYPARALMVRQWRDNRALDKWLGYLLHQGHSVATMRPAERPVGLVIGAAEEVAAG